MDRSNVIPMRPGMRNASDSLMGQHYHRLMKRFSEGGKQQLTVFQRLSVFLEELETEVKETYGPRSGKLSLAYGDEKMPMKSRFSAKGGVPPKQIYSTPGGWLNVLEGFAEQLGRNKEILIASALERAFEVNGSNSISAPGDYAEVFVLLDALKERLVGSVDLIPLNEYVTRSGLYVRDGIIEVSEWPWDEAGLIDGMIYNESAMDFMPRVFGLNGVSVAEVEVSLSDLENSTCELLAELKEQIPTDGHIHLEEARLIGMGLAVDASTGLAELALLEWDRAVATIRNSERETVAIASVMSPVGKPAAISESFTGIGDGRNSPSGWHPTGVRAFLKGSSGFNRLLRSTLIRPWIWSELNPELWAPTPHDEFETYPVLAPVHTVAAFIEGNLLYADDAGKSEDRIDRRLLVSAEEIEAKLKEFRERGEETRRPRKAALLSEWGVETGRYDDQ